MLMVLFSFSGSNDFAKPFPNSMASFANLKLLVSDKSFLYR